MPAYAYAVILAGTVLWFTPFVLNRFNFKAPQTVDRRARWGMLLELIAYSLLWQGSFWTRSPRVWQVTMSVLFLGVANLLSWSGARALGRELRLDAAVGKDHELIRSGPYRVVRHPIYASMLCVILGTGLLTAQIWMLLLSIVLFVIGTEIRVRVEDGLLASRFGLEFRDYRSTTPRYIPFLW
jgi:protein-S-isoprenylcysteine O-methyltransferase Ste14